MTFPKPVMTISELVDFGFSRRWLTNAVHTANNNFVMRTSPKGVFLIDTEEFEIFLKNNGEMSRRKI